MAEATESTATLVLGEEIRMELADRLGLTADEFDDVPVALEISLGEDVEGFAADQVRVKVRTILTKSPAFRSLPPATQQAVAHNMVRVL
jgi:hypothetical protein